jgi:hypothetical protein
MITPTVGRVILIKRNDTLDPKQPEPGIITYVHENGTINVVGFTHAGVPFTRTSFPLAQDDERMDGEHAYWMPYQKAVAAGTIPPVLHAAPPSSPPPPLEGNGPMEPIETQGTS